ncbi:MAG: ROK family protein [Fusobacteriota bacterium]
MYIVLDIGGTNILGALFDENNEIVKTKKKKTKAYKGEEEVFKRICKVIDKLIDEAGNKKMISGIGAGAPGIISENDGIIITSPNLPWKNYNLKEKIQEEYNIPFYLENDVNVGILGEWRYGAGKGADNLIGMFIGTGIGGGLVLDGSLYKGNIGGAGEIGHISVNPDGPVCGCNSKGCIETLASKTGMLREIEARIKRGEETILEELLEGKKILKSSYLKEGYDKKDRVTLEILEDSCKYIGVGVASLINILNPDVIVFGGGIMEKLGEELLSKIRNYANRYAMKELLNSCEFKVASLGDDAPLFGGLELAKASEYRDMGL